MNFEVGNASECFGIVIQMTFEQIHEPADCKWHLRDFGYEDALVT